MKSIASGGARKPDAMKIRRQPASVSSEFPVDRPFRREVLSDDPGASTPHDRHYPLNDQCMVQVQKRKL